MMATSRLAQVLRSQSNFTDEEIGRMTEQDAWQWIHANASATAHRHLAVEDPESAQATNFHSGLGSS